MEEDVAEIVVQKSPDGAVTVMLTDDDGETTPVILHQSYAEELRDKLIEALQPDDQLESSSAALVEACALRAVRASRTWLDGRGWEADNHSHPGRRGARIDGPPRRPHLHQCGRSAHGVGMMAKHRKSARASSRAHVSCPECGRRQHGERGLDAHKRAMHPEKIATKEPGK